MAQVYVHHVCSHEEARAILEGLEQERFWVANCGCREDHGRCAYSRHDVCLWLDPAVYAEDASKREITRQGVEAILGEAAAKLLVSRPFRDAASGRLMGFCFCCPDCCSFFQHPGETPCDKGNQVEVTQHDLCTACGDCVDVCYFGARRLVDGEMVVEREACHGCGLCRDVCPAGCIAMVAAGRPQRGGTRR